MVSNNSAAQVIGLVVSLGMFTPAPAPAQSPVAPMAIAKEVKVSPGELSGKILQSGTRAGAEGHTVTIRTMDGKKFGEVVTNANGSYTTPALDNGWYVMEVAKGMKLQLHVGPGATIKSLDVVVPQQALTTAKQQTPQPSQPTPPANPAAGTQAPATPGGAAGAQAGAGTATAGTGVGAGLSVTSWGLIGLGAAAAIAVPVALSQSSNTENVVSPVTSPTRAR